MSRLVEADYLASQGQFNDQLRRDVNQQLFQMSLQRDIERSLTNNPEFSANLLVPRAEFASQPAQTILRQERLDRDLMNQAIVAAGDGRRRRSNQANNLRIEHPLWNIQQTLTRVRLQCAH